MSSITNKNIWITGASSGIGEALAIEVAKQGAYPILSARNLSKLNDIRDECLKYTSHCWVVPVDLSKATEINRTFSLVLQECSHIDILINNAGRSQRSLAVDTPIENDREIMELNFFSAVSLTKLVLKHMLERKKGHIIAVGSITGKFGFPMRTAYSASKHAMQGFFEALQCELHAKEVNVTIVHPGRIRTNISSNALTESGSSYNKMDDGQNNGMPAELCAKLVLRAIKKNKKEVLIGRSEILMVYIRKFIPWLFYKMAPNIKN